MNGVVMPKRSRKILYNEGGGGGYFGSKQREEREKRLVDVKIGIHMIGEKIGLDFEEFGAIHEGMALQNLNQFYHVSYEQDDRRFTSQAWNRLFRIKEQVVREYVTFRDHIEELDVANTMVFQLGAGLSTTILPHIHGGKDKVTLDDLFLLHSMDGGVSVDVPWHVAKFLCDKVKGYNGLGIGEMVAEIPEVAGDDDVRAGQAEVGGVGRHPNMSTANRLRAMDERLGEIVNDQGVNFMSDTPGYSTAPSPSASQFGMFADAHPSTSRNQDDMNED
ncbi:hypothetical protein Tco_0417225 [Tanacetum coccineum]